MRFGRNPNRALPTRLNQAELTVATLVYIPVQSGYFKQSLDVLRLMLASLRAHTAEPFDLLVFDNGSCAEVREYLLQQHEAGVIQVLIFSEENVGTLGAYNAIFGAAPGQYIAFADSDYYFEPGWWPRHRQILETYPKVGMVAGVPIRHRNHANTASTFAWARTAPGVRLEAGRLIDPAWIADYCEGMGWDPDRTQNLDYRITLNGVPAYIGALHGQFVLPKSAALSLLPLPTGPNPMEGADLDHALDAAGYLRLSTDGVLVHHLGNALTPRWEAAAARLGVSLQPGLGQRLRPAPRWRHRAVHNRVIRPIVAGLYNRLFEWLTQKPA